ncbi:hypothetical protein L596_016159 [Steinernema carpocapsae]|uniref:Uncharacterized protein n=1 Tax=Steinernema carpocapsae TaxID=34508 RepID=A0A4U5NI52_STECR|nr:hypothetical protein L596_016159 [Steinernema carpocapsae]
MQHMAPTNSSGINQIMRQLSAVIQLQAAHARRDELRAIPRLEGFEGAAKVKEFFDSFEDATLGGTSQERTKLLRQKCRNRAQHLLEDLLESVGNHYDALKASLSPFQGLPQDRFHGGFAELPRTANIII